MARGKTTVWLGIGFAVVFLAAVALSTFRSQPYRCRVCLTYNGQTDCRTASAQSQQEAVRTAVTSICAQLAGGVTDTNHCENTRPTSIDWK